MKKILLIVYLLLFISFLSPQLMWCEETGDVVKQILLAGEYLQTKDYATADSLFSHINDDDIHDLGPLEMDYYYCKGLVKYHLQDFNSPIKYFVKAKELHDSLKQFDYNYYIRSYILSHCYYMNGDYVNAENNLRWTIVKHRSSIENNSELAANYYLLLADIYEAMGDTLTSENIHFEKVQYFNIQKYLQNHPDDILGQKTLENYNQSHSLYQDHYSYIRTVDDLYVESEWMDGENMVLIGEPIEAVWCFQNCIRNANRYIGKYNKAQKYAYLNLLKTYATNGWREDFDLFMPIAIDYINNIKDVEKDNKDNEFALGKIYGNIFLEHGDYEEAYKCYLICKRYLESGKSIEDQYDQEIRLYLSMSSACLNLSLYNEVLTYCDSIENKITTHDKDHDYHLYWACMNRGMTFVRMGYYDKADEQLNLLKQNIIKNNGVYSTNYIEVCVWKGMNFILQEKYTDAIKELSPLIEYSDKYNELWSGYEINANSLLASAYMGTLDYKSALGILEKLAKIEKHINGEVSDNTKELINECKAKL